MQRCYDLEFSFGPICVGVSVDLVKLYTQIMDGTILRPVLVINKGADIIGESNQLRPVVGVHRSVILFD